MLDEVQQARADRRRRRVVTQDMGSGTHTALGQAAAMLGVPLSRVTVELGDTLFPEGPFSGGLKLAPV